MKSDVALRPVIGWPGYFASSCGYVYSIKSGYLKKMATFIANKYQKVVLTDQDRKHREYVHRIVAKSWCENSLSAPEVNHINGIKSDNSRENLEWVTRAQNNMHARRVLKSAIGELHGQARLKKDQIVSIRKDSRTLAAIAKHYGVSVGAIQAVKERRSWAHVE